MMIAEDYSISWNYIVSRMETRFLIDPTSMKEYSFWDIVNRIDSIWQEYKELKGKMYDRCKDCTYLTEKDGKWYCEDYTEFCLDINRCITYEV